MAVTGYLWLDTAGRTITESGDSAWSESTIDTGGDPITFVASSERANGPGADSFTLTKPAGITASDTIFIAIGFSVNTVPNFTVSGGGFDTIFTDIDTQNNVCGLTVLKGTGQSAGGSWTITSSLPSTEWVMTICVAYSNVDYANVLVGSAYSASPGGTNFNIPAITFSGSDNKSLIALTQIFTAAPRTYTPTFTSRESTTSIEFAERDFSSSGSTGTISVTNGAWSSAIALQLGLQRASSSSPQTWTGSAGTSLINGTSGSFIPSTVTWIGSSGTVLVNATSGTFAPSAVTWTGSAGTILVSGTTSEFSSVNAWIGSPCTALISGTTVEFIPGSSSWTGSSGTLLISGTSSEFISGSYTWVGSSGTSLISGTSGVFIPGIVIWTGSNGTVLINGTSNTFIPNAVTWSGSNGTVLVSGTTAEFTPSTVIWSGSSGTVLINGTSGAFTPNTANWTGSSGTILVLGTSGSFLIGNTWIGSSGNVTINGVSNLFVPSSVTWIGSTSLITLNGLSGNFTSSASLVGSLCFISISGDSGTFIPVQKWVESTGIVNIFGVSGDLVLQTQLWVGNNSIVQVQGTSSFFYEITIDNSFIHTFYETPVANYYEPKPFVYVEKHLLLVREGERML